MNNTGVVIFTLIKFVGYFALLHFLFKKNSVLNLFIVSFVRSFLGVSIGLMFLEYFKVHENHLIVFYAVVMIFRMLEWALVLRLFYPKEFSTRGLYLVMITTLVSSVLDLLAFAGFVSKTGLIC